MFLKHKSGKVCSDLHEQAACRRPRGQSGADPEADLGQPHLLHRPAVHAVWGDPGNTVGQKWPDQGFLECSAEELDTGVQEPLVLSSEGTARLLCPERCQWQSPAEGATEECLREKQNTGCRVSGKRGIG